MARTLSTYSLASLDQAKRAFGIQTEQALTGDVLDNVMDSIEWASAEIERFLCRNLVTRGSLTEYHTVKPSAPHSLWLRQYPVTAITSISEGYWLSGVWTATTVLTASDYLAAENGELLRLDNLGGTCGWPEGLEKVKVVYAAGYATTAAVPDHIRRYALALAARRYAEVRRGEPGAQMITDGQGTMMRYLPAQLLRMEQEVLANEVRFTTTGRPA